MNKIDTLKLRIIKQVSDLNIANVNSPFQTIESDVKELIQILRD